MAIESKIKKIIAEELGFKENEITDDKTIVSDLGADSLDIVELTMAIEENFVIEVPDEDLEKLETVKDVIDYVKKAEGNE